MSLRERKKQQTRQLLSGTATELFLAKGFDAVRVTEIAEACGVSEKTVFNYFPTKEALILDQGELLPAALRSALADASTPPVAAALAVLAGELGALIDRMSAHPDFAEARAQTRRFGELIRSTPSLRAYQHEATERLTTMTAGILASRAGTDADAPEPLAGTDAPEPLAGTDTDAPEPLAAAHALLGLWPVQYASLRRHLETAATPESLRAAVTADVRRAARVIEDGLAAWNKTCADQT